MSSAALSVAEGVVTSTRSPFSVIRRNSTDTRYVAGSSPILLRMISAPRRPSRTRRVGATRRSPTPAPAGVGKSAAAVRPAARMDLVQNVITAIPTLLLNGAIADGIGPEWFIFGQP